MYMHKHIHTHTYTHTQVDSAWNSGDQEGAKRSAQTAKKWNIAAVVSGIIIVVVGIVVVIIAVAVSVSLTAAAVTGIPGARVPGVGVPCQLTNRC